MDSFTLFLTTTDWFTVLFFWLAGIASGWTARRMMVHGAPPDIQAMNRILTRLKRAARRRLGKRNVTLADIEKIVNSTF